jgi:hypothetical protein
MDAQQPITETSTCRHIKANGEFCKRSVTEGEAKCWQHASSWQHGLKSLTGNQALLFALGLLSVVLGIPSPYFSVVSWRDAHPKLTIPSPPTALSLVAHPPVSVVPDTQAFVSDFVHDNYIFTISNDTEKDLYQVEVTFKITASSLSFADFSIMIPASSRKPTIDGSRILDISGVRGSDASGQPILLLSVHRLTPHEVREISFTRNKLERATVTATCTYSTAMPQARLGETNKMTETFHPLEKAAFDSWLTFLANGSAEPKNMTIKIQKNKEESLVTTAPVSAPIDFATIVSNISEINLRERAVTLTRVLNENWMIYHHKGDQLSNREMGAQLNPPVRKKIDKERDQLVKNFDAENRHRFAEAIAVRDTMLKRFGPSPEADALTNIISRYADLASGLVPSHNP